MGLGVLHYTEMFFDKEAIYTIMLKKKKLKAVSAYDSQPPNEEIHIIKAF